MNPPTATAFPHFRGCIPGYLDGSAAATFPERLRQLQVVQQQFSGARPPSLSLRGGRRPTWRPEREARGSALGVQSREGTRSLYRPPLKWYAPIASVAALTAQPLAALPPYGCGVPFTGSERLAGWQYLRHKFIGVMLPSLSLRGGRRPTRQSREGTRSPYKPPLKWKRLKYGV